MFRLIMAVVCGYAGTGVLIFLTDQLFGLFIPGFKTMKMPPLYYFAVSLCLDTLYSIAGGYICAVIAQGLSRTATWGLILFGEGMGLAATIMLWKTVPHWWSLALMVLYPPAVWIGSSLRTRAGKPVRASMAI